MNMPLDYIILLVVAVIGIGGGLLVLREAKKYRTRRNPGAIGKTLAGMDYTMEMLPDGDIILKRTVIVPANERWLHEPAMKEILAQAKKWMRNNPAKETNLDSLEAEIHHADDKRTQGAGTRRLGNARP